MPTASAPAKKYRILVVEDDPHIARLMLTNLSAAGLECRYAPDGTSGLAAFEETKPDLVLLDLTMPGMDGRDVCTRIRETSTVPIIFITALDSDDDQLKGFKLGADDYLAKPFNPRLMVARVVAQLRRAYRYDTAEQTEQVAPASSLPSGWASCDACGYMGPRSVFQKINSQGVPYMVCPHCQQNKNITCAAD